MKPPTRKSIKNIIRHAMKKTLLLFLLCLTSISLVHVSIADEDKSTPSPLSIAILKANLAVDTNNDALRLQLISALMNIGEFAEAHKHLQDVKSTKNFPPTYETLSLKILWAVYIDKNQDKDQKQDLKSQLLSKLQQTDYTSASYELSNISQTIALGLEKPQLAIAPMVRIAQLDEQIARKWYEKAGDWSQSIGMNQQALTYYQSALNAPPGNSTSDEIRLLKSKLAHLTLSELDGNDPSDFCQKQLDLKQQDLQILKTCLFHYSQSKQSENIEILEALIPKNEEHIPLFESVLSYYLGESLHASTQKTLETLKSLIPENADHSRKIKYPQKIEYTRKLAQVHEWQSQPNKAFQYWKSTYQQSGLRSDLKSVLRLSYALFEYNVAEDVLKDFLTRHPADTYAITELSQLKLLQGYPNESIELLSRLESGQSNKTQIKEQKMKLLFSSEDYAKAIEEGEKAIQLYPKNKAIRKLLVQSYLKRKQYKKAYHHWQPIRHEIVTQRSLDSLSFIDLALYSQDIDTAVQIFSQLSHLPLSAQSTKETKIYKGRERSILQQIYENELTDDNRKLLVQSFTHRWKKSKDRNALDILFNQYHTGTDSVKKQIVNTLISAEKDLINDPRYLEMCYQHFSMEGDNQRSQQYLMLLAEHKKNDPSIYESLIWNHVELQQTDELVQLLNNPIKSEVYTPQTKLAIAAAYHHLNRLDLAYQWYLDAYPDFNDHQYFERKHLPWLTYLTYYQDQVGFRANAKYIRQRVYQKLEYIATSDDTTLTLEEKRILIHLRREFSDIEHSQQLLLSSSAPSRSPLSQFEWYKNNGQISAAHYWLEEEKEHASTPYYQQEKARLAMFENDENQLEKTIDSLNTPLLQSEYYSAKIEQGYWQEAQTYLTNELGVNKAYPPSNHFFNNTTNNTMHESLRDIRLKYGSYLLLEHQSTDINELSIQSYSSKYYGNAPLGKHPIQYSIEGGVNTLTNPSFISSDYTSDQETFFELGLTTHRFKTCTPEISAELTQFHESQLRSTLISPSAKIRCRVEKHQPYYFSAGIFMNQVPNDSELLRLFAKKHELKVGFERQSQGNFDYQLEATFKTFELEDTELASGFALQGVINYPVFQGYEYLNLVGHTIIEKNQYNVEDVEIPNSNVNNDISNNDTSNNSQLLTSLPTERFIAEDNSSVAVGFEYGMGIPSLFDLSESQMQFQTSAFLQQNLSSNESSMILSGFISQPLKDKHEIRVSADLSTNAIGENTHSFKLSYIRSF